MDYLAGHEYQFHPQGLDHCYERSEDGEYCGLPLEAHPLSEPATTGDGA